MGVNFAIATARTKEWLNECGLACLLLRAEFISVFYWKLLHVTKIWKPKLFIKSCIPTLLRMPPCYNIDIEQQNPGQPQSWGQDKPTEEDTYIIPETWEERTGWHAGFVVLMRRTTSLTFQPSISYIHNEVLDLMIICKPKIFVTMA